MCVTSFLYPSETGSEVITQYSSLTHKLSRCVFGFGFSLVCHVYSRVLVFVLSLTTC